MPRVRRDEFRARCRGFFLLLGGFFIVFGLANRGVAAVAVGFVMLVPAAIAMRRHRIRQRSDSN